MQEGRIKMHNRYDTGQIVDLQNEIAELKDKLENMTDEVKNLISLYDEKEEQLTKAKDTITRRNTLITDLRGRIT